MYYLLKINLLIQFPICILFLAFVTKRKQPTKPKQNKATNQIKPNQNKTKQSTKANQLKTKQNNKRIKSCKICQRMIILTDQKKLEEIQTMAADYLGQKWILDMLLIG